MCYKIRIKRKAQKDTENWRYEIECVGIGKAGTKVIKVWSYSKKAKIAIAQAKMKHKECMDELRSACQLYGPPGMWDLVVKEQAAARQRHKEALELQAKQRDRLFWGISLVVGVVIFVGGVAGMIWGLNEVVNG